MSIFRKPLGAYTRGTPDWFASRAAAGLGYAIGNFGATAAVGLYNNATDGTSLFVYGLGAGTQFSNLVQFAMVPGPLGALYCDPSTFAIDPTQGQPNGQIMIDLTTAQLAGIPLGQSGFYIMSSDPANDQAPMAIPVFTEFPLAIVRPGYTFAAYIASSTTQIGAFFYYVQMSY